MKIIENFPHVYSNLLPTFFDSAIPRESLATCQDCAMCSKGNQTNSLDIGYFSPTTKCCTYYPTLPNYLVGAILCDSDKDSLQGQSRILEKIRKKIGITPHSISPPRKHALLYSNGNRGFGRSESLVCSFYVPEDGICSIWKNRESVCSTYFCKSISGVDGKDFWNATKSYLSHVQNCLAWYVLKELNFDLNELMIIFERYENSSLDANDLDDRPCSDEEYSKIWQRWAMKEEDFYRLAFQIVTNLSSSKLEKITGIVGQVLLEITKKKREDMTNPKLPNILKRNPAVTIYRRSSENSLVLAPSGFFEIKNVLSEVLQYFDGTRTNAEARELIKSDYGEALTQELLISLYQNRVLIP